MKLLDSRDVLAEVKHIYQKIQASQIDASDDLKKVLGIFSDIHEKDMKQEINFIKKYNPEVYNEYLGIVKKYKSLQRGKSSQQSIKSDDFLEKDRRTGDFVERYARDKKIAALLNQVYDGSDTGYFNSQLNNVYQEGNMIFVDRPQKSKIFTFDEEKFIDTGKTYHKIQKCGDFYLGIQVVLKDDNGLIQRVEGSETYTVIDKKGHEIRNLRGHLHQRSSDGIYVETYTQGEKEMCAYYDESMNMIVDNITSNNNLISLEHEQCLFQKSDYPDVGAKFIVEKGQSWNGTYMSEDIISNQAIYKQYNRKIDAIHQENMEKQLERNRIIREGPMDFDIGFDENGYIKSITDKSGNLVFVANDGYNYISKYPGRLYPSDFKHYKSDINKGIFILHGLDSENRYKTDVFINAKEGIKLKFDTYPQGTFIDGQVMKHFITGYTAELYNLSGQKLGKQLATDTDNYNYKTIVDENGKKQLVECKTGTIKEQKFDEELKRYDEKNEIVVVVRDGDDIREVYIEK